MRLLVLGGTQFVGRAIVEAALAAGDEVTLFHRGRTNPGLFTEATHLVGDREGDLERLATGDWDACLDVSGYVPHVVRASAELLASRVRRYAFVSTISVYADLAVPRDEDGPRAVLDDAEAETVDWTSYGALKALCEDVVRDTYGQRATIVRPGYVIGGHDHTGRFPWWVHRAARGGEMLVPESLARAFQAIDARDLAAFTLGAVRAELPGPFNATGPVPPITLADALQEAAAQSGVELELVVVDDGFLAGQEPEVELPLWPGSDDAWAAWAEVDVSRALAAGLTFRPLADTVAATLADPPSGNPDIGLAPDREAALLAAWRKRP